MSIDNWHSDDGMKVFEKMGPVIVDGETLVFEDGIHKWLAPDGGYAGTCCDAVATIIKRDAAREWLAERGIQVAWARKGTWGVVRWWNGRWQCLSDKGHWRNGLAGNLKARQFADYDAALIAAILVVGETT